MPTKNRTARGCKTLIPSAARNLLLLSVAFAVSCGGPRVSKQKADAVIEASTSFNAPRLVYVPRVIAIPADGIVSSTAPSRLT